MNKRGIISILTVGLIFSSLSLGTVHAEDNQYELSKKAIDQQNELKKPLNEDIHNSRVFEVFETNSLKTLKGTQNSKNINGNKSISAANKDPLFESEYNDEFRVADSMLLNRLMYGQFLPMYDTDIFKVTIPKKGLFLVAGSSNSYAIELAFGTFEKDYKDNGNLEYLGSEFNGDVEVQVYQVHKGGTYYISAFDYDNTYDLDDNTYDDMYAFMASFVDNVKPTMPTVNKVDSNDKVVTGKAEPNSSVNVRHGKTGLGTAKATSKGDFSVKITAQKAGAKLTVTAKDAANNVSPTAKVTVAKASKK
ncbi:Ig-like domain-containing protein [Metabacillus sediminilitoris]|uniref:Protease n=1 Tax=Metabacillus sediminilitoris TaxID=2567941 RepID=A0A4S4BJ59_9BACI|nr:Ig-like domain-containing protein [Metabacillus sediminilitoris]QGQ48037.1 protease [Metabacillus sediminilitoris]THF74680.1 protease [Metabacillus sediminilitoris]